MITAYKCNVRNRRAPELAQCIMQALPIMRSKCCIVSILIYTYIITTPHDARDKQYTVNTRLYQPVTLHITFTREIFRASHRRNNFPLDLCSVICDKQKNYSNWHPWKINHKSVCWLENSRHACWISVISYYFKKTKISFLKTIHAQYIRGNFVHFNVGSVFA